MLYPPTLTTSDDRGCMPLETLESSAGPVSSGRDLKRWLRAALIVLAKA